MSQDTSSAGVFTRLGITIDENKLMDQVDLTFEYTWRNQMSHREVRTPDPDPIPNRLECY